MIEVENLRKAYGPHLALEDISFKIAKGEVVGFLGPNGAGKTTTMRILTGYMPATSGRATIAGFDVQTESLKVRQKIGYLPENAPLYPDMDVLTYLRYVAKMRDLTPRTSRERIKEVAEICGLDKVLGRDILILDEPTSGLDPNQIVEIRDLIKRIGRKKTIILSTHIMQEVQATCQRILIINEGIIVASGTHAELAAQHAQKVGLMAIVQGSSSEVTTALRNLAGVKSVKRGKKEDTDTYEYLIGVEQGKDLRAEVFKLVVQNDWVLWGLELRGFG